MAMGSFRNHSFPCFSSSRGGFGAEILSLIPWSRGCACGLRPCNTNLVGAEQSWEGPTSTPCGFVWAEPRDNTGGFSEPQCTKGLVRQGHNSKWSDGVEHGCSGP